MNFLKGLCTVVTSLCILANTSISTHALSGIVTADILNIRSTTNTSSDVISKAHMGDELEIIASDGTWHKVALPDLSTGYVKAEYVTLNQAYYGVTVATNLIVRASTGIASDALATLPYGSVVELLAYDGAWYKIKYNGTQTGYVSADYVSNDLSLAVVTPYAAYGYVNATLLNLRETTSLTSPVLTRIPMGACVQLLEFDGVWYKVMLADSTTGYVSAEYISDTPVEATIPEESLSFTIMEENEQINSSPLASPPTDSSVAFGASIVQTAYQYMGCPYVWAADGPDKFDCSGFTMYIMNLYGIQLPHQSGQQYNYGSYVEKSSLIPGDLVFFSAPGRTTVAHVGIYAGGGNFIHASSGSAKSVTVSSLSADYYTKYYLGAKRLF